MVKVERVSNKSNNFTMKIESVIYDFHGKSFLKLIWNSNGKSNMNLLQGSIFPFS